MCDDSLGKKRTLWSTLADYNRIEIPVIQRDYAQGRDNATKIRDGILNHILSAAVDNSPAPLDFIYGYERKYDENDTEKTAFIPIDGQQRLTTLWLIHWFLANKAGRLTPDSEIARILLRFVYQTRPSSADFLFRLCTEIIPTDNNFNHFFLKEADWFDENWKLDPSVMGFINVLEAIRTHPRLAGNDCGVLFERLTADPEIAAVSFYFLPLRKFGLGEEIYTRMNARGKKLSNFEIFKSNFYKIIDESELSADVKGKIEYDWVKNLWRFREKNEFVTDKQFIAWLRFMTQMIFISSLKRRETPPKDFDYMAPPVLQLIYSDDSNLALLIHSFDILTDDFLLSPNITVSLNWDEAEGLKKPIEWILSDSSENHPLYQLGLFAAILFIRKYGSLNGISEFLRVVRNLIGNTADRAIREWPAMIESIRRLISPDVYQTLRVDNPVLQGFRTEQRDIERYKAFLINSDSRFKDLIKQMDNDSALKGRIGNLVLELEPEIFSIEFALAEEKNMLKDITFENLSAIFKAYVAIRCFNDNDKKEFNGIWGEFLSTGIYQSNSNVCWWETGENDYVDYANHPVVCRFAKEVMNLGCNVMAWRTARHKDFIAEMMAKNEGALDKVSDPKEQLFILYIITTDILQWHWNRFFARSEYNFGWVNREKGYKTPFECLLSSPKQIFQTYPSRFVGDYIIWWRTPQVLMVDEVRKAGHSCSSLLDELATWASR
ncbi:MAG: DUF262 domain-containing protein [Muribaculaceae bacterium]|nr:DUF262 domain-containing protein [Muribaculaceae bacterium]